MTSAFNQPDGNEISNGKKVNSDSESGWEQRWHPLLREWVIYSAHRQNRPWTGELPTNSQPVKPAYDPACYLCPGNTRISDVVNPDYNGVFVFDNDRPSLSFAAPANLAKPPGIYANKPATGLTRVICYSPTHNTSMSELSAEQVEAVVMEWQRQTRILGNIPEINSVNIFENKGELCGMSNPHPHGQIYATNFVYKNIEACLHAASEHHRQSGQFLFEDIVAAETSTGERVIGQRESTVAFVPYFARFAYETYLVPLRRVSHITQLTDPELADLASLLHETLIRMDNLWSIPFPYLLTLHQAPLDGQNYPLFQFHIALYPPLRTPELRKYVAAHEIGGGNFLADTMPEDKAAELRNAPTIHYMQNQTR
ncbi:MAG: galactose-1-phosphate uridylyltransferase [Granulosicoccus sp.]